MTLDVAHSKTYANYNKPVKLRIFGAPSACGPAQLLFESDWVNNSSWKTLQINFTAKGEYHYLILEPFVKDGRFSHKGNILIDNISAIKSCIRA